MTAEEQQETSAYHFSIGSVETSFAKFGYPRSLMIDIEPRYRNITEFRTTLGHKVNHSFEPNASFDLVDHPVFGGIVCVFALLPIQKNGEILVNYGYGKEALYEWFRRALARFQTKEKCFVRKKICID